VPASVLIVDDQPDFREAAAALLTAEGFDVVGAVEDGPAAVAAVERLRPAVVLLDLQLPGLDGFGVAELLAATAEPPAVVLISGRPERTYGARIAAAPARGFIAKNALSGAALAAVLG
jgi:DNA-binding NarL/FixJ family response regulator